MAAVTIYSTLSGKPFRIILENYPHNELPRLSDEDIADLTKRKDALTDLDLTLLRAEQTRAKKKIKFYSRAK